MSEAIFVEGLTKNSCLIRKKYLSSDALTKIA